MAEKQFNSTYKQWYDKYNEEKFKIDLEGITARNYDFVVSNTGFRKLIVQEWMDKVLGELPILEKENPRKKGDFKEIKFDFVDEVAEVLEATLAYGYVFVLPENRKDGIKYTTLTPDVAKKLEYVYDYDNDKLTYLAYETTSDVLDNETGEIEGITFRNIHEYNIANRLYTYAKFNAKTQVMSIVASEIRDSMIPFFATTRDNHPVWFKADVQIDDIDSVYAEMMLDMQLSRKMILLPDTFLTPYGAKAALGKTPMISENARIFRTYPTDGNMEGQKPLVFDGKFDPEPYINTINLIAHKISFKTGFGKGYFSYDKIDGFKTATEISAGRNDMNLAKTKINNILVNIIKTMLTYQYPNTSVDDYNVSCADSILSNELDYKNKLYLDVTAGLINTEFYLKESYGLKDVSELMPDPTTEVVSQGGKNLSGVNGKIQQEIFTQSDQVKK